MTQNETSELGHLARGLAGHLGRRRALGMRRITAIAPPAAPTRALGGVPDRAPGPAPAPNPAPSAAAAAPAAQPQTQRPQNTPQGTPREPRPEPQSPGARAPAATPAAPPAPVQVSPTPVAPEAPDVRGFSNLTDLGGAAASCQACPLGRSRHRAVFSTGSCTSGVLFLDEAPSPQAEASGDFFQGPGGQLLADIVVKGMGLALGDVQVTSLVKCLPPEGRPPEPSEVATCRAWLNRQIELLQPKVIVTLGRPAATALLGVEAPLARLRGQVHGLGAAGGPQGGKGVQVVTTYHPAYLARTPEKKKDAWIDIQLAMKAAGIPLPNR